MFVNTSNKVPIKIWMDNENSLELGALQQASNVANLPFVHKHVALMPDAHQGYGVPIGCVFATTDVIIPNAVGVDIGCGMGFVRTNIKAEQLDKGGLQQIVGSIMRGVPTGFSHHKKRQECCTLDEANNNWSWSLADYNDELEEEIERGYKQVGTLGGGNHFIEIQKDEDGFVCIMLHSGSRNLGYKIANTFNKLAKQLSKKWYSEVPSEWDLAYLPIDSDEGKDYIAWMNLALSFAQENRLAMMDVIQSILADRFYGCHFSEHINAHHNYATLENHYGKNVWVHRKGAIMVREGVMGIIPGSMGSSSYIVEGLGNQLSFHSSSHGAGRKMGRKEAMRQFPVQQTIEDLNEQDIVLGKISHKDVSEEARWAYKDIDSVISQELDLIKPVHKLSALAVIKG